MKTDNYIYDYIADLVNAKFVNKEKAIGYCEKFHSKKRLSDEEYKDLILLIESTYEN
ncbi:hypothetical protein HMPREF1084_01746 [Clostridium butyricum 60E.3]|uniref:hypothetical protein n=1 Tax=Clostridium butyricum TaxID=1492 RepID=UPI0002D1A3A1|nr:hypothetical protein [Clostridium butyricum]ENZ33278.1 hypothetical protein HMPREF1084_01746 [Clostridium butyricum 60E.3]MDU1337581.1 hypothetical protein [Clostridium butyricum]MDU5102661.1 hypothetical protein [Clostridium butyricum]